MTHAILCAPICMFICICDKHARFAWAGEVNVVEVKVEEPYLAGRKTPFRRMACKDKVSDGSSTTCIIHEGSTVQVLKKRRHCKYLFAKNAR